jgi:hypothetical protein
VWFGVAIVPREKGRVEPELAKHLSSPAGTMPYGGSTGGASGSYLEAQRADMQVVSTRTNDVG